MVERIPIRRANRRGHIPGVVAEEVLRGMIVSFFKSFFAAKRMDIQG